MPCESSKAAPLDMATVCVLLIGDELLSGRTQDTNLAFIAKALNKTGARVCLAKVLPDCAQEIVATINATRAKFSYVFTTGGIGPTHDDITAACVAQAFNVPLVRHGEALQRLAEHYKKLQLPFNAARQKMACIPKGASLIDNPISAAPGFRLGNVVAMAGIPKIMQAMLSHVVATLPKAMPMLSRTVHIQAGEGLLASGLASLQKKHPKVRIGSYPWFDEDGSHGVCVVVRCQEVAVLQPVEADLQTLCATLKVRARFENILS